MPLSVLSVASEAVPLVKTGGLADVAGALPGALAPHGVAVTTLLPGFPSVNLPPMPLLGHSLSKTAFTSFRDAEHSWKKLVTLRMVRWPP